MNASYDTNSELTPKYLRGPFAAIRRGAPLKYTKYSCGHAAGLTAKYLAHLISFLTLNWYKPKLLALLLAVLILPACSKKTSPSGWPDPSPPVSSSPGQPSPGETFPVPSPVVPDIDWTPNANEPVGKTAHNQSYTDGGGVVMDVSADYPSTSVAAIDAYYAGVLEDTVYRCDKLSSEAKSLKQKGALTKAYGYSEVFTVELNAGGLMSVRRVITLDTGGSLPDTSVICDTFKVSDGKMLTLDDFFTVSQEEYSERLLYGVRQYIDVNKDDLFGDALTIAAEAFPYDCFCVTQAGLSLFYPEQTIAPQSMGVIRVDVPWEVFGDIWRMP